MNQLPMELPTTPQRLIQKAGENLTEAWILWMTERFEVSLRSKARDCNLRIVPEPE